MGQFMSEKCTCAKIESSQNFQIWPANNSFSLFLSQKKRQRRKSQNLNIATSIEKNVDLYLLLSFRQFSEKGFLCRSSQVLTMAAVIEVSVVFCIVLCLVYLLTFRVFENI